MAQKPEKRDWLDKIREKWFDWLCKDFEEGGPVAKIVVDPETLKPGAHFRVVQEDKE